MYTMLYYRELTFVPFSSPLCTGVATLSLPLGLHSLQLHIQCAVSYIKCLN